MFRKIGLILVGNIIKSVKPSSTVEAFFININNLWLFSTIYSMVDKSEDRQSYGVKNANGAS